MKSKLPRVVIVYRESEYEQLLARHATHGQAAFFLHQRSQSIDLVQERHHELAGARHRVATAIPERWRRVWVDRGDLAQFLFEPDDFVVVLGQDGLVANVAKYLDRQLVIGLNPDPSRYEGILVPHPPEALADLLHAASQDRVTVTARTMVRAELDDHQSLLALNEIFVGVQTHQSARYRIRFAEREERQSSSGLIVATGTGATGWARSIGRERGTEIEMPQPQEHRLVFFVREAFPSVATGSDLTEGAIGSGQLLEVISENERGGVIFGDGIESDYLRFDWGQRARLSEAPQTFHWVAGRA